MKTFSYIIIFIFILSCNKIVKKETKILAPNEKLHFETNYKEINDIFIKKIKSLPIQKLPYEFIECSTNSLSNLELLKPLYRALQINTDSLTLLNPKKDTLFYLLNNERIYNATKTYAPKYYYFLLDNIEKETKITFSNPYIYKRLPPMSNNIEILLIITKIFDNDFGRQNIRGTQIDVISYDTKLGKSINRKRLITTGIGLEDIAYYECFQISNGYDITTKSYMHLEDEATSILRNLEIDFQGKIKILKQNVKVTD